MQNKIKVLAFDVFNTVFDMSSCNNQDLLNYSNHLKDFYNSGIWKPLVLPKSWETLPAHIDSADGIKLLKNDFIVVTCSNCPLGTLTKLSKYNKISWDAIIPLELNKTFKTMPESYMTVCEVLNVKPENVAMITANKTFGDIEASKQLGMTPILIRNGQHPNTITELSVNNLLGR